MRQLLRFGLLVIISLLFFSVSISNGQPSYYKEWLDKPTEVLMNKGIAYFDNNKNDSALVCFGIVGQRYNKDLSEIEKTLCCHAYLRTWFIYFSKIYNYSKSYENLLVAAEINENLEEKVTEVDLGFAYFWHTLYLKFNDRNLGFKAISYYKKCFHTSLNSNKFELANNSCVNMLNVAQTSGYLEEVRNEYELFKDKYKDNDSYSYHFTEMLGNTLYDIEAKNYDDALVRIGEIEKIIPKDDNQARTMFVVYNIKAQVYDSLRNYREAFVSAAKAENIAKMNNLQDMRLDAYSQLAGTCAKMNDAAGATKYWNRYYQLKDSLLNFKQLENVSKLTFGVDMKKMEDEIKRFETKNRIQNIVFSFMLFIILLVVVFAVILYKKICQLNSSNRELYDKNLKIIEQAELEHRRLRDRIVEMEVQPQTGFEDKKYKNSSLDDNDKDELLNSILKVMGSSDEIYSVSFSAERLAELTGINYKYISQVINEKYDCNFNIFLNKYRIEEACRRLSNIDEYGNYTVEAIAESVGFKSRSAFSVVFKKATGLTPVNYRKIAIERHNE